MSNSRYANCLSLRHLASAVSIVLFLVLAVPSTSSGINLCTAAVDDCTLVSPIVVIPGQTGVSIDLWFTSEDTIALAYLGRVRTQGSGTTVFTSFSNGSSIPPGGCANGPITGGGTQFVWVCGDGRTIDGSFHSTTLTFDAGAFNDTIILSEGIYLSYSFSEPNVENVGQVLVRIVPEPGTVVLLGAGLAGLAFLRRKGTNAACRAVLSVCLLLSVLAASAASAVTYSAAPAEVISGHTVDISLFLNTESATDAVAFAGDG